MDFVHPQDASFQPGGALPRACHGAQRLAATSKRKGREVLRRPKANRPDLTLVLFFSFWSGSLRVQVDHFQTKRRPPLLGVKFFFAQSKHPCLTILCRGISSARPCTMPSRRGLRLDHCSLEFIDGFHWLLLESFGAVVFWEGDRCQCELLSARPRTEDAREPNDFGLIRQWVVERRLVDCRFL